MTEQFTPEQIRKMDADQLLQRVKGKKAVFTLNGKKTYGTIVGGVMNPLNHPYVFKAFHIITDADEKTTQFATQVTIIE